MAPRGGSWLQSTQGRGDNASVKIGWASGWLVVAMALAGACRSRPARAPSRHAAPTVTPSVERVVRRRVPVTPRPVPLGEHCPSGMVYIPAGTFAMGSVDGDGQADQHPQHPVTVGSFCMDRTEVTVNAYTACVHTGACAPAPTTVNHDNSDHSLEDQFCNGERADRGSHPINCVDWQMATDFCAAQGDRLPTEAEWEYGARGTDGRIYPWGNDPPGPTQLNACGSECVALGHANDRNWRALHPGDDGWGSTAPVGSYPAGRSPFGLDDMAGNVWEWTSDWYGPYGDHGPPRRGRYRVFRGGGWIGDGAPWVRAALRGRHDPTYRGDYLGFRCARGAT